jgi:predicted membrane-bound spermidine synthase/Na+-translocating ferredoxin:NAD+ oxidoreductase RnfG subunit
MRLARGLLIFSYGLFTIAAQTLLFREFVTAFEGNDISVGVFFGSWFLWVGLGAILVRRWDRFAEALLHQVELLFLLYIPAFIAQLLLIVHVRELAGVASYDLLSVQTLVLWALVVNAPVSLVTGVLFPVACRWIERADALAVSRVYILEAAGSFAGGLAVTALLAWHVHTVRVFFLLALVLLLSVGGVSLAGLFALVRIARTRTIAFGVSLALALLAGAGIFTGSDDFLAQRLRALKWGKLLPREALAGAFCPAQAEYLYGEYGGQWVVVREGSACEALPNEEAAGRTTALTLCQNPEARRVLVVGSGLALCRSLLVLPQIEEVTWAHADGEYVRRLLEVVPPEFGVADQRLRPVTEEIRPYLRREQEHFDLAIVNLPDVTGSVFNRYYTLEFYQRLKASLRPGGVVAVSIAGGENVLGAELAGLGASAQMTLERVFGHLVLVPGDQTWLLASDSDDLTGDPALVRDHFASIPGAQKLFPATGLLSVYLPDRAAQARQSYAKTDLPPELLLNHDARPLTHLYGLLLAARQSGASVTRLVKLLAVSGWLPFIVPVLIFAALRTWALATSRRGRRPSSFDSSFLVFSTGWVGIATVITLMYSYETHFGSLYLYVGVISSLFMVGLTLGAMLVGALISRCHVHARVDMPNPGEEACLRERKHGTLLVTVLLVHGLLLAALAFALGAATAAPALAWAGHGFFAAAFVLSGLCCGGYWPIAAAQLAGGTLNPGEAGSRLETADHLGACLGGLATSLLLVPVLGIAVSLLVLIGLLLANLPAVALSWKRQAVALTDDGPGLRQVGYALFGVGACIVVCSNVLARAGARLEPSLPQSVVRALAPEQQTRQASVTLKDSGKRASYFTILDAEQKPAGYLFSSADFALEVRGFGGRFNLAVHVDAAGKLLDFLIVRSNETPSYLSLLQDWLASLKGKALFASEPFRGVQAVTGATVSSEAVLAALELSGQRFAVETLARGPETRGVVSGPARRWARYLPDPAGWYLLGAFVAALGVAHWGGFWSRLVVLGLTFVTGGVALNAQYSSEQIATLLSFDTPAARLTGVFLLAAGVPVLVLLFGNLYCGYLCPFGAAQELLGYVLPRRLKPAPGREEMRLARFVKYLVLVVLLVAFFLSRDRRTLAGDPLVSVFGLRTALSAWPAWMFGAVGAAVIGSLFYVRPWCRYLCPAGAFLSLLNHVRLLRRLVPAKWFGRCEFGLTASDHLDCLYCDRCRHTRLRTADFGLRIKEGTRRPAGLAGRPLVLGVVVAGLFVAGVSVSRFREVMPLVLEEPAPTLSAGGQPRDVDVQKIRTLIQQGQLSDRKAEYYQQAE